MYFDAAYKADSVRQLSNLDWVKAYIFTGDFLNDFKTNYIKPLIPLILVIPFFFLVYLRFSFEKGLYIIWSPSLKGVATKDKYTAPISRLVGNSDRRRASLIFYFTLVSTLGFGYLVKYIDLQTLISAIQKKDYSFKLEGRIKAWSTLQALIFMACLLAEIAVW
jgi:hypothetical protein